MEFVIEYVCGPYAGCRKVVEASNKKEAEKILLASEPDAKIKSVTPAEK